MRTHAWRWRTGAVAIAAASGLMIGVTGVASANSDTTGFATTAAAYDLLAGQDQLAGQVLVWDVDGDAYVQYVANHGWCITETHVEVAADEADIPQTRKGNPIPGQFSQGETFDECVGLAGHYVFAGAFSGGPDVVVAAHAAMRTTLVEGPSWATMVVSSSQGLLKNGNPVAAGRSDANNALLADYQGGSSPTYFFSLGFGGEVTVGFGCDVMNGDGDDIRIYEATNGNYPTEFAEVYASMNGTDWELLGTADNGTPVSGEPQQRISSFDLGALPYAKYVRVLDVSDPALFEPTADAFDVDGVEALQDCKVYYESAWADGSRFVERGNWATYAEYTEGDGTLVDTSGRELTFLVFDLGDSSADLGGMAWFDGPQQYAVHTICAEVAGDKAWFTYQIPLTAPSAPGAYVTFNVTAGAAGPVGYAYSSDMTAMVGLCEGQVPITGGYGPVTSGNVIVHPGLG